MHKHLLLDDEKFWLFFEKVNKLSVEISFTNLAQDLGLQKKQLRIYIEALKSLGPSVQTFLRLDEEYLKPIEWTEKINIEMTVPEWIKFQAHFPYLAQAEGKKFHKDIFKKLAQLEIKFEQYDLFKMISEDTFYQKLIDDQTVLTIQTNSESLDLLPRKVLFLDGSMTLIGERVKEKTLTYFPMSKINDFEVSKSSTDKTYSDREVEDFVSSLRLISESCIRLVLKVYDLDKFNMQAEQNYFEKPCIFSNLKGESIWAATVEPNDSLYDWIYNLGASVEILDPVEFKKEFLEYCESKLKKIA